MLCRLLKCQNTWDRIIDVVGEDPITHWVYGPVITTTLTFWVVGLLYAVLDIFNKPSFLIRYKMQPEINQPVDINDFLRLVKKVLINQILVFPLACCCCAFMEWRGYPALRELPTFQRFLFDVAGMAIANEIGFYYMHRALHSKYLYKYVHKTHHEWGAPIALSAEYNHPIEHLILNVFTTFVGVMIMGSHVITSYLWLNFAIIATLHIHSGYHLPFLPSPEFHDFHHAKFDQNFGVLGILDRLHGTDSKFRKTAAYARHRTMFDLVPPREKYPDDVNNNNCQKLK